LLSAEKKYPEECEEARQDSFRRIIDFIETWRLQRNYEKDSL